MTYTWRVKGVKTVDAEGVENAVVQTYWEKIGTDENGNEGTFSGATPFAQSSINAENFIPFEELTEEIVLGWIQGVVVGSYEDHVNAQIQKQIDLKVVKEPTLPWVTEEVVEPIAPEVVEEATTVVEETAKTSSKK
jgi:hypothetical protein